MSSPGDLDEIRRRLASIEDPVSLLEGFFANAPFGLQIHRADGHSLLVNNAFREMFGSEPPPEYSIFDDDIAKERGVIDLIKRAFAGETLRIPPVWYDARELKSVTVTEGRRVAMESTFFPLVDRAGRVTHVAIVFRDVTAELSAREQVEAERDLLKAIIEQSGDAIIVCDVNGQVTLANAEAQRQRGSLRLEDARLESEDGRPLAPEETPLARALRGEAVSGLRWRIRRPDGSTCTVSGTARPLRRPDGSLRGAVLISHDESERLVRESEREQTQRFREELLAVVGHDLRAPLSAILLSAMYLVQKPALPEPLRPAVNRILTSAERMKRMIANLLDLTRTRLGQGLPLTRVETDLRSVVNLVLDELRVAFPGRKLEHTFSGDTIGFWDPDRMAQVVSNLVVNALSHGGEATPVAVSLDGSGADDVILRVHNWGPPIPAEIQSTLFDPFRRHARARAPLGLGLGLYIVEQIALAHGGRVVVSSSESEGTVFEVRLPRRAG